ncbi:MAG TPA: hypothetical protein DIT95_19450 [Arenibacter sp.]|nr:hypothetical protein [Arenibacter sp.]
MVMANAEGGTTNVLYLTVKGPCRPMRHGGGDYLSIMPHLIGYKIGLQGIGLVVFWQRLSA